MAFQSHRTRFKGDLANIKQNEIIKLNYDKETLKERLDYINMKYSYVMKYHEEYTSEFYKVNVNTNDNLSSDINVFKALERDGSYLLNSLDIPRDEQYKYNILTQEEFDKILEKEEKSDITDEAFRDILKPKDKNDFINMDLKITHKDLNEDSEMGEILRQYNKVKLHLNEENKKIKAKENSYLNLYKIKMLSGTINCDMDSVKKSYKGITRPSTKLGDIGSAPDYNAIKYSNSEHIKAIIKTVKFGDLEPDSMLSHLACDIQIAIKNLHKRQELDHIDLEIIEGINSGVSLRTLEKELKISNQAISKRFNNICKKIALFYSYIEISQLEQKEKS